MNRNNRILFLLQDFPYPPVTGINRKAYGLISYMASRGWRCDVLCFGGPDARAGIPAFEAAVPGVKVLSVETPAGGAAGILKKGLSLLKGLPPSLGGYDSSSFRRALREAGAAGAYSIVHYDVINMSQYLSCGPRAPSILSSNDAVSLFYERMIKETHGFLRRLYLTLSRLLIARFEKRSYPLFSMVQVVSREDAAHLKNICPGLAVEVIPIGVEISSEERSPSRPGGGENVLRVAFTGNLDIAGIANGLFDFLDRAYGDVVAGAPAFEFYVLGPRASSAAEKRILSFPGTKYFRWVEDYPGFLRGADILLSLDRSGTGIKTRVLDAMALGKPVVGTSIAFGGLTAENGKHCFVCNTPRETGEALKRLLADKGLREKIGGAARTLAASEYSMRVVGAKWEALYEKLTLAPLPKTGREKNMETAL